MKRPRLRFGIGVKKNPEGALSALPSHLGWLSNQNEPEAFERFFSFALSQASIAGSAGEAVSADLLALAEGNAFLALLAWETLDTSGKEVTQALAWKALGPENFAEEERFDRILTLMGLLEPVDRFTLRSTPFPPIRSGGSSWIEWICDQNNDDLKNAVISALSRLPAGVLTETGQNRPGLFLLKLFLIDSPSASEPELDPAKLEPTLDVLSSLTPRTKAELAALIGRHVRSYASHDSVREWVWQHHSEAWQAERERLLSLTEIEAHTAWPPEEAARWIQLSAKLSRADEAVAVARHCWELRVAVRGSLGFPAATTDHPSYFASFGTRSGVGRLNTRLPVEPFSLLLALGKEPFLPPNMTLPTLETMTLYSGKRSAPYPNALWRESDAESFLEIVTDLGSHFVDDPLRFLIVTTFHELSSNFSKTLSQPSEIARFQRLAEKDDRPGAWLAKDLAELLPRWWIGSKEAHDALLAAGGSSYSYDRMTSYLADGRTPLGARCSFALGCLPWHSALRMSDHANKIGAKEPYFPQMGALALEFANEFKAGRWRGTELSDETWRLIINGWLRESEDGSIGSDAIQSKKEARSLLIESLEKEAGGLFDSLKEGSEKERRGGIYLARQRLQNYATLLRIERRTADLIQLWENVSDTQQSIRGIFPWVPDSVVGEEGIRDHLFGEGFVEVFREGGWEAARKHLSEAGGNNTNRILTEASAMLGLRQWVELCVGALDLAAEDAASDGGTNAEFYALPPSAFLRHARGQSLELRIEQILAELDGLDIPERHEGFFRLALPVVLRQFIGYRTYAPTFLRDLETRAGETLPAPVREALVCAADQSGRAVQRHHLEAMRDPSIPLAQRWLGANYFLAVRIEDNRDSESRREDWREEDWSLMETGADLLIEALDRKLPIWECAKRGLGMLDPRQAAQTNAAVSGLLKIYMRDREGQAARVGLLMKDAYIEAMLRGQREPTRLLHSLHMIALESGNEPVAVEIFMEAEPNLEFEEKLVWLSRNESTVGVIPTLLRREWRNMGKTAISPNTYVFGDRLRPVLSQLTDDPDLLLLAKISFSSSLFSIDLTGPGTRLASGANRTLGKEFVQQDFKFPEMERIALSRLPVRAEEVPGMESWLDKRIPKEPWWEFLQGQTSSIRAAWPYWARRIELLAGTGEHEALLAMLPDANWFRGRRTPINDDGTSDEDLDRVEEIVWMTFAREAASLMRHGSEKERLGAEELAVRLLGSLPDVRSNGTGWKLPGRLDPRRSTSFYDTAAAELAMYATGGILFATLDEPAEVALKRVGKFRFKVSAGPNASKPSMFSSEFLRLLAKLGEELPEDRRRELFLRGCEAPPYNEGLALPKPLPWFRVGGSSLPQGITRNYLVTLARARLNAKPGDALRLADLGLCLHLAGDDSAARPILDSARAALSPRDIDEALALDEVARCLDEISPR